MHKSASIDHLTFNQVVTGSNPVGLTNKIKDLALTVLSPFLFRVTPGSQTDPLVDRFSRCKSFCKGDSNVAKNRI